MTDYKQLCAELVDDLEMADWPWKLKESFRADIQRARAALAEPDPETVGPTDEALSDLWSWSASQDQGPWPTQQHCFARAVLARWGQ